ncbi:flavin reductase family protein [Gordonia sp. GONU]|uniref:flavin reductase family protein n=1 Tax=Gordonia TaxID=2053 RepID=UPI0021ACA0AE|nr:MULTISPECIES: flavin reductase family protein [Gordonia]MCR8897867.1 flavin reductase family protein [Gordonia sp. GONU]MCZ0915050.1 flavin reductase family protein [Gordonia amicalis]MCZ4652554.1 flavin reductase family protein [Gordonia amicalis]
MPTQAFDHDAFKKAVGQFPSGLTIVTGVDDGRPHGMTLQSFMSLSLEPALIAIAPARTSTTWPVIAETGSFAVNILSEQHSELARKFASSGGDRFESLDYTTTSTGNPILGETVTWFDCRIADILDGGDHVIVLGEVLELGQAEESTPREPIIFHRSGFRRLAEPTPA